MSQKNHNTCKMHDKSRGMVKEASRDRFMEEKKEMEHELAHNKTMVTKLMNENFIYESTSKRRGGYVVKFQNPETHKLEKLTFQYEPNLKSLETEWLTKVE